MYDTVKPYKGYSIYPDETPQNAVSHFGLYLLIRISLKNNIKMKTTSDAPENQNGPN